MARSIVVEQAGEVSSFAFSKVDRSKLYGRRQRIPLDPSGARCTRASLTEDGSVILRPGMLAQGYFDHEGEWIAHRDLVGLDAEGQPLEPTASTLGRPVPLEGPIDVREMLQVRAQSVYWLEPEEVSESLTAALQQGHIFRLPFSYRGGWEEGQAFLVANLDGDLFALVGRSVEPEWCAPNQLPVIDDDDDLDDDLDFEMF